MLTSSVTPRRCWRPGAQPAAVRWLLGVIPRAPSEGDQRVLRSRYAPRLLSVCVYVSRAIKRCTCGYAWKMAMKKSVGRFLTVNWAYYARKSIEFA